MIRFPKHSVKVPGTQTKSSFFQSFKEGARFLSSHKVLRYVTSINLLKAVTQSVLLVSSVLYVKTELHLTDIDGDRLYSLVVAAIAIGIIIGTTLIGTFDRKLDRRFLIVGGLLLQGAAFLLIQFHPGSIAIVLLFGMSGFGASGALTPVSACFAESTPNEVRGRVYSVVNSLIRVAMAIGYSIAGLIGENYGSITLLTLGGLLLLVSTPLLTIFLQGFTVLRKEAPRPQQQTMSSKG
ncbi:MAG: MFS transporter [Tumebacillaceae bacterium]